MARGVAFGVTAVLAIACGSDGFVGELREPPPPPATTSTTTGTTGDVESSGTTNDASGDACSADAPCGEGAFCAAPSAVGNVVGVGDYVCSAACVEEDDPGRWCLDAASCCDPEATCEIGFCRVASSEESSSSGMGMGSGSGSGSTDTSSGTGG